MASNYRRFLELLKKWPLDKNKEGRDLGQHIRDKVKIAFAEGDISQPNQEECDKQYNALKRLSESYYSNTYPRKVSSSSTGLKSDQCTQILSNEFLELMEQENRNFISKLFSKSKK